MSKQVFNAHRAIQLNNTSSGKVRRSSTGGKFRGNPREAIKHVSRLQWNRALDLAKEYLFRIHGEPEDGRLFDKWLEDRDE